MRLAFLCLAVFGILSNFGDRAHAHTITFNWTWPTTNQDGTALALSAITAATIYDATQPSPGAPGTVVPCTVTPLPPTAATGTCTTGTIAAGTHGYILEVSSSVGLGAPVPATGSLQVIVPQSTPSAATGFSATVNNP